MQSCESLEGVPREVTEMQDKADMTDKERAMLSLEYTERVRNIQAWKAHLPRSGNQVEWMKRATCSKETVMLRRRGVLQENLVLSTALIMWIGHRKEIQKLTFRALALSSERISLTVRTVR